MSCTKYKPIAVNNGPKLCSFSAYLSHNMKFCAFQFAIFDIKK
jgi:hypothetical protein